jgi:hypothetical protein
MTNYVRSFSQVLGLHPANTNQLPAVTQQPVSHIYPQQFQIPQYPNFLPLHMVMEIIMATLDSGVIGGTGHVEDVNMSKYEDNNLYTPIYR